MLMAKIPNPRIAKTSPSSVRMSCGPRPATIASSLGLVRERYPKWDNRSPAMGRGQAGRQLTLDQPIDGAKPGSPADIGLSRDLRSADASLVHLIRWYVIFL